MAEHRTIVLVILFLIFFFFWMDICLYHKIQDLRPQKLPVRNNQEKHPPIASPDSNMVHDGDMAANDTPQNQMHHSFEKESDSFFSPFKGLSVKLMMMDQVNNYLITPLAEFFNDQTNLSHNFSSISPNMISLCGILWAFIAAKLVTYDNSAIQRLSVFCFQIRTFCDALDGIVARDHLGIKRHVSLINTSGYLVDGLSDTVGFMAYLIGCYYFLQRTLPKHNRYWNTQYLPLHVGISFFG